MNSEINKGDRVKYIDVAYSKELHKSIKVEKFGFWDGEKVILEDKERTTVRNLAWLTKV